MKAPTNKQKCDYYLKRMDDPTPGPCDPRYAAAGQKPLFTGKEQPRVSEQLVAGIDPGPKSHGLIIRGPFVRAFRAPIHFAGDCSADEIVARLAMAGDNVSAVIMEWAATNPHIKIKNKHLDDTIGQQWIVREKLLALGLRLFCVPRQVIVTELGVPAFAKGKRDKHVREELRRLGYESECSSTHEEAALAAALLNYRDARNAQYLVT